MSTQIAYYDSDDPSDRRRSLILALASADSERGRLYRCERAEPGDMWPAPELVGSGYSRTTVATMARREKLVQA